MKERFVFLTVLIFLFIIGCKNQNEKALDNIKIFFSEIQKSNVDSSVYTKYFEDKFDLNKIKYYNNYLNYLKDTLLKNDYSIVKYESSEKIKKRWPIKNITGNIYVVVFEDTASFQPLFILCNDKKIKSLLPIFKGDYVIWL